MGFDKLAHIPGRNKQRVKDTPAVIFNGIGTNNSTFVEKNVRYGVKNINFTWEDVLSRYTQLLNRYADIKTCNIFSKDIVKILSNNLKVYEVTPIYQMAYQYRACYQGDIYSKEYQLSNKLCNVLESFIFGICDSVQERRAIVNRRSNFGR